MHMFATIESGMRRTHENAVEGRVKRLDVPLLAVTDLGPLQMHWILTTVVCSRLCLCSGFSSSETGQ